MSDDKNREIENREMNLKDECDSFNNEWNEIRNIKKLHIWVDEGRDR